MNEQRWRDERDNRTMRYAGRRLDSNRWIALTADEEYAERYEGQVALLTAANLLGRMSPSIALAFPDVSMHPMLPWPGRSLHDVIITQMLSADPFGRFTIRDSQSGDFKIHFGRDGKGLVAHGFGWNAYIGAGPSPLPDEKEGNPIGAALAAILAASQLFVNDFNPTSESSVMNAFNWQNQIVLDAPEASLIDLGNIWVAGTGSVGTAVLYFLALSGRPFSPTLIDMDRVKRHNLDRSPIFIEADVGCFKVEATRRFLAEIGITDVQIDAQALHESKLWFDRAPGTPDILVPSANEMNVRYHIEAQYPPIQLYGTTGRNWQTSIIRHIPSMDACSCCLFPEEPPTPPMACASTLVPSKYRDAPQVDAALPFLSFNAGLMTVAEMLKLSLPGYPFSANRVTLLTRPAPRLVSARIPKRNDCICGNRSQLVHNRMQEGCKFDALSLE